MHNIITINTGTIHYSYGCQFLPMKLRWWRPMSNAKCRLNTTMQLNYVMQSHLCFEMFKQPIELSLTRIELLNMTMLLNSK